MLFHQQWSCRFYLALKWLLEVSTYSSALGNAKKDSLLKKVSIDAKGKGFRKVPVWKKVVLHCLCLTDRSTEELEVSTLRFNVCDEHWARDVLIFDEGPYSQSGNRPLLNYDGAEVPFFWFWIRLLRNTDLGRGMIGCWPLMGDVRSLVQDSLASFWRRRRYQLVIVIGG